MVTYQRFVDMVDKEFKYDEETATVRNDRENGLYVGKCGEWRMLLGHASHRCCYLNVRTRESFYVEIEEEVLCQY